MNDYGIKGGQGRTDDDVIGDGRVALTISAFLLIFALFIAAY